MPRIGMNPSRGKKSEYTPARVTVAVLTYVPHHLGYFKNRFDVLRACLESILVNTAEPFDLMVFDNGSSQEVVEYLKTLYAEKKIDFLVLSSQNIGKIGALQFISRSAPGEVIAYSDDDVFFLPGWLERHLEIMDTYPRVGLVTGFYIKSHMDESISSTMKFSAQDGVIAERVDLVDEVLSLHYIEQMGRTMQQYQKELEGLQDVRLTYQGITTFVSAGHHQFVCFREALLKALPNEWTFNLMGLMRQLDASIDQMGLLRLSTALPATRLLGNLIDPKSADIIKGFGIEIEGAEPVREPANWLKKFYSIPFIQRLAYSVYERLFNIINLNNYN